MLPRDHRGRLQYAIIWNLIAEKEINRAILRILKEYYTDNSVYVKIGNDHEQLRVQKDLDKL